MSEDDIHHAHDKLFKAGFSDPANTAALLQAEMAPEIACQIDWSHLQLQPGSFIDSQFRTSESDLLFSAPLAGRDCRIYLLFEHQTQRDPLLALHLLRYMVRIWESLARASTTTDSPPLTIILPFVLAQNAEAWHVEPNLVSLLDLPPDLAAKLKPHLPDFLFHLIQLATLPFEAIRGTPSGILILRTMKAERLSKLLDEPVWDESLLVQLPRETFELLLRYILAADIDKSAFVHRINSLGDAQTKARAMTLAQQFKQEGRQEGRQQGRQEGEVQMALRQVQRKFPEIAAEAAPRVKALSEDKLLAFGEAILFFATAEDCLKWLADSPS